MEPSGSRIKPFKFLLFILPSLLLYGLFFIFPVVQGVYYSFTDWNGINPEIKLQFTEAEFKDQVISGLTDSDRQVFEHFYHQSGNYYIFKEFREVIEEKGTRYVKISPHEKQIIRNHLNSRGFQMIRWIGLDNYKEIFTKDKRYKTVVLFSVFFTVLNVLLTNLVAFLLALAVDRQFRGRNLVRSIFFIPNVISLIIVAFVWYFVFKFITRIPLFDIGWFGDPNIAPYTVIIVSVWQGCGYIMMIYLAGLQGIPQEVMEVAEIDGASGFRKLWSIMIPMMLPSFTISIFLTITNSLRSFDVIFALTQGGPGYVTTPFVVDIYFNAFSHNRFGYGTAKSVILGIVIIAITTIQLLLMKRKEVES